MASPKSNVLLDYADAELHWNCIMMESPQMEAPPPYSKQRTGARATSLDLTASTPTKTWQSQTSAAQLRHFLRHVLFADYQMPLAVSLSSYIHHFTHLACIMNDMKAHSDTKMNWGTEQILDFTNYPWAEIHQPSKDLFLPTNTVLEVLHRFHSYSDESGVYKGCTFDVLYREGMDALAAKVWVDRRILFPVLFDAHDHADMELRSHLEYRMKMVQFKYFFVCRGPYWFYRRSSMNLFESRHLIPRMTISLMPGGEEYIARRARYLERGASKESKGQGLPWYRKILGRLCNTRRSEEVDAEEFERIERKKFDEVLTPRD